MERYIGKMLDNRYEILEVIGQGGMAVVFKAKCHRLNRLVAIKVLKPELADDAEFRRRFHDESQAVAMLSHPNIVSVYDVSKGGGLEYIVMELIDGITLKQYMERRGQLNWREALHFITQVMRALSHAHSRGIIHRDIKPQNIMILRDGSVKVADFGIACLTAKNSQTMAGKEAMGSVHYISPEQAKGERIDQRSDIYSVGMLLRFMLSGSLEVLPRLPGCAGLRRVARRCTAFDPRRRYPSASALLRALSFGWAAPAGGAVVLSALVLAALLLTNGSRSEAAAGSPLLPSLSLTSEQNAQVESPLLRRALELELGLAEGEEIPLDRLSQVEQLIVCGTELPGTLQEHESMMETAHDRYISQIMHGDIGDGDLSLLERCTNLKVLVLDYQQIRDISPLEGLPLEYLSLAGNQVTDIRALSGCTSLQVLDLEENPVRDIQVLEALPMLRELCLEATGITSLEVLSGSALEELNVHSTWVTDYGVLADCGSLRSLVAGELPSGAWESIAGLVTLEELRVYSSSGLDLSLLEGMENLRDMDLYGSSISKPEALALLPRLRNLNLGETGLMDLSFMPDMPALAFLDLRENPIEDFGPLLDCPQLRELNISSWQSERAELQLEGSGLSISVG